MPWTRLGLARLGAVAGLAVLTFWVGLGGSGRLTYHEAFVSQAAREMLASNDWLTPTVGGRPWLEKPPLAIWLVALMGRVAGGVTETTARIPSAVAASVLTLAVAALAARRFGPSIGLLAGLIQATTAWTVMRGRLAEVDILLAMIVTLSLLAFDQIRTTTPTASEHDPDPTPPDPDSSPNPDALRDTPSRPALNAWRWLFFTALGFTALAKGIGFGAVMVLATIGLTIAWDRDGNAYRRLRFLPGWILAAAIAMTWPVLAALRHPSAVGLWLTHVTDRLGARSEQFIGQSWWAYHLALLGFVLPWTPLALAGAWRSLPRSLLGTGRFGGDRLLWAWTLGPLALLSFATVKNAHYAIHALPPCSIWAAGGLTRLGIRWQRTRGWSVPIVRRTIYGIFGVAGVAYAVGFAVFGPVFDRRGVEWAFYETAGQRLRPGEPVALLYDVPRWDRMPYETPFGPVPHDWAVRLFYLRHEAPCRFGVADLARVPVTSGATPFAVIGRPSDEPNLKQLGRVETLAQGPADRSDRTYRLYRVTPAPIAARNPRGTRR